MKEEEEDDITLAGAAESVNLVISSSSSYSIRSFPLKWQSIREKLGQLYSALIAAAEVHRPPDNLELTDLLQAIVSTAREAQEVACQCCDEAYSTRKLLLRSNLNVVEAKLDAHIKHLAEIYASGVLTHSRAIIVSKPGPDAGREVMRFYVRDLFSRLKIGSPEMRVEALTALNRAFHHDEKFVKIVAADGADSIGMLVSLVEFRDVGVQEEALEAISVIAGFNLCRGALVVAGAIAPIVKVLETGSTFAKERAARALQKLTENSDNAWSVSSHGGVTALLKICEDGSSGTELVRLACGILKSLSSVEEIKRFMVEEGAIPVFLKQSRAKEEPARLQAMEFLSTIARDNLAIKQKLVDEGAVESLVPVLDLNSADSSKTREAALRAIEVLCFSSTRSINTLISSGFLDRVLFLLRSGEVSVQHSALKAVCCLCGVSEEAKKVMGDSGFMPELVRVLEAASMEVREMAAEALCSMLSVQRNRRRFIEEEHNVGRILQLLSLNEEKPATARPLLSALMCLAESNSGRRKIACSEYVNNLERLAESNVAEAKKIVKKLTGNKFRSILNGIWSSRV